MMNKILNADKALAVQELKLFLTKTEELLVSGGFRWYPTDKAPESFKALKKAAANKVVPIASYGCTGTIYGGGGAGRVFNMRMRFWHDVTHLALNQDFSPEGELIVIEAQLRSMKASGLSTLAQEIFWADFAGQVEYYREHRVFVANQDAFVDSCLAHGIQTACKVKH